MTVDERYELELPDRLANLAMGPRADYLQDVLRRSARTGQRPAWTFPERWLQLDIVTPHGVSVPGAWLPAKRALLLVGLIGLIVAAALVASTGSRQRLPPPFGPARNGLIAYARGGDIYVGDPVTGVSRAIVTGPTADTEPDWSPDGTRILFVRAVAGGSELVVVDADGSHPVVLNTAPFVAPSFGRWSPDGRAYLLVSVISGDPRPRLWLVNADGSGSRILQGDVSIQSADFRPPDGREILIRGQLDDPGSGPSGVGLYLIDADGTNRRTLVAPNGQAPQDWDLGEPRYSPDGSLIAYHRLIEADGVVRLHVMNADGTSDRVIPANGATFQGWARWSPDGTRLAIIPSYSPVSTWADDAGWDVPYEVVRADGTGTGVRTGPALRQPGGSIEWSPDGAELLMRPNFGTGAQVILDPGGGPPTTLPWESDSYPSWQRLAP